MITGVNHIGISVADMARAVAFYRDLLGLEQLCQPFPFDGPLYSQVMGLEDAKGRMCVLRRGGLQLELFEFDQPTPAPKDPDEPVASNGISHFGVDVEDIDETYRRLKAAGVRFHCPVTTFPSGMKATYGRDMDGNVFELLQRS